MSHPASSAASHEDNASNTDIKPVEKFNDGPVHVSIWENHGVKGTYRAATFEIRYRDGDNHWQTGHSYSSSSLLHLETAAREARARIERWRQSAGRSPAPRA